ncbi:hypothetical protein PORCRE_1394 [Porphyromonas crevioricanis JCM 15906]|uniref:Uncharacterized protein n=1 Tax=Porphyromonas crevioricanis JCM 15906 TaxID=1305617 RepID=T1CRH6_9PORP|nr:hypothetical protein PORCRE_1394 [Porphyromonas crevioricanis JCM 15906]GAD06575.1 hypothetical protein PORCAN_172 [Porphyromonas crevioricanis JCM 13913]
MARGKSFLFIFYAFLFVTLLFALSLFSSYLFVSGKNRKFALHIFICRHIVFVTLEWVSGCVVFERCLGGGCGFPA